MFPLSLLPARRRVGVGASIRWARLVVHPLPCLTWVEGDTHVSRGNKWRNMVVGVGLIVLIISWLRERFVSLLLRRLFSSLRICSNQAFNRTIFYNRKFGSTKSAFLNGHISETKKDTIAPNSSKSPWDQRLSSTLSWKWSSLTLSPSFGPLSTLMAQFC